MNNLAKYTLDSPGITHGFYGFTEEEVNTLIRKYKMPKEIKNDIKEWYDGYNINGSEIYNPWAIVKCIKSFLENKEKIGDENDSDKLKQECIKNYWEESGSIAVLNNLFKYVDIRHSLEDLLNNKSITIPITTINQDNYWTLIELGKESVIELYEINDDLKALFFNILFQSGYLTPTNDIKVQETLVLKIPNKEIKAQTIKRMMAFYLSLGLNFEAVISSLKNIFNKDKEDMKSKLEKLRKEFQKLLRNKKFPKIIDIKKDDSAGSHDNEDMIHSLLSIIALQIQNQKFGTEIWKTKKIGRLDIIMINENGRSLIFELKYNKTAKEALNQCEIRNYSELMKTAEALLK